MRLPDRSLKLDSRSWMLVALALALVAYGWWFGSLHLAIAATREELGVRMAVGRTLFSADEALTFTDAPTEDTLRLLDGALGTLTGSATTVDDTATIGHLRAAREALLGHDADGANEALHHASLALRGGSAELSARLGDMIENTRSAALGGAVFGVLGVGALAWALWALKANEAWRRRWTLSTQATSDGLWEWDIPSGEVEFSGRWKELFGVDGSTLEAWYARVHADDLAEVRATLERHVAGELPVFESEHRVQDRAGRWRWMLARGLAERAGGRPSRMVCWQTDITDRRTQADAAERAALIGHVADATGMAVYAIDDADLVWQSNAAAEALGRSWGGALGFWTQLARGAGGGPTLGECPDCGRPQRTGTRVVDLVTPAGARRVCQLTWTGHGHRLVRDRVVTVVLVADVTLRALAEEGARTAHARVVASDAELRATIDAVPSVVFVVGDGRVLFANRAARQAFGEGARAFDALGSSFAAAGGGGAMVTASVRREGDADASYEVYRPVPITFQGAPAELWVAADVTRRVQAETQLRTAERMVALGGLAAGLAHEINNPLTYVIGNLELAQDGVGDVAERISRALGGAVRVRQVVAQLRTLSNQGQGELGPVAVAEALDGALNVVAGLGLGPVTVTRAIPKDLEVHGNAVWLGQIALNLFANALQAMAAQAAETRTLHLEARVEGGAVLIEVTDSGPGVPPALGEQIFEPFVSSRLQGDGTGLGLYICRELARRMEAELSLVATGPAGTTFRLRMKAPGPTVPARVMPVRPREVPLRVLVVDDDPQVGRLLQESLRPAAVTVVHTAADALASFRDVGWDAIVLDIALPDGSGIELYERLVAGRSPLAERVVFVSGGSMTPDVARFMLDASSPVVLKPFDLREFRTMLEGRAMVEAEA